MIRSYSLTQNTLLVSKPTISHQTSMHLPESVYTSILPEYFQILFRPQPFMLSKPPSRLVMACFNTAYPVVCHTPIRPCHLVLSSQVHAVPDIRACCAGSQGVKANSHVLCLSQVHSTFLSKFGIIMIEDALHLYAGSENILVRK